MERMYYILWYSGESLPMIHILYVGDAEDLLPSHAVQYEVWNKLICCNYICCSSKHKLNIHAPLSYLQITKYFMPNTVVK